MLTISRLALAAIVSVSVGVGSVATTMIRATATCDITQIQPNPATWQPSPDGPYLPTTGWQRY